jgi:hypothetical protein
MEPVSLTSAIGISLIAISFGIFLGLFIHGFKLVSIETYNNPFFSDEYMYDEEPEIELGSEYKNGRIKGGLFGLVCRIMYGDQKLYLDDASIDSTVIEDMTNEKIKKSKKKR